MTDSVDLDPVRFVAWRHVFVADTEPDSPVDELTDDVGVPGVAVSLGVHVHEDLVHVTSRRSGGQ